MTATAAPDHDNPDRDSLQRWMMAYLATICGEAADRLDPGQPLAVYDLDSVDAVEMALEMEKAFGIVLHPETFLDTTITVAAIATAIAAGPAGAPPASRLTPV
ncbi:hypothetical protein TSH100_08730 [Azospirillum sp. TSH100]|uniref:acyl carrier protein n=1 Tax=Azospirillum sp. TSH100 TaxID=652764 RepID=UPI000D61A10D|nr:acyl carrier protein [Azospirillum sp. TSH100]PWC88145.1 hypothetical protein TSH100_08730 [Azospirillum sp. TSH100]QCG92106.1 acyl carrier protein [Azospirillum sp. TSH100]